MFNLHLYKVALDIVWGSIRRRYNKIRYRTVEFLLDSMTLDLDSCNIDEIRL
jgi:hypothetical protein